MLEFDARSAIVYGTAIKLWKGEGYCWDERKKMTGRRKEREREGRGDI